MIPIRMLDSEKVPSEVSHLVYIVDEFSAGLLPGLTFLKEQWLHIRWVGRNQNDELIIIDTDRHIRATSAPTKAQQSFYERKEVNNKSTQTMTLKPGTMAAVPISFPELLIHADDYATLVHLVPHAPVFRALTEIHTVGDCSFSEPDAPINFFSSANELSIRHSIALRDKLEYLVDTAQFRRKGAVGIRDPSFRVQCQGNPVRLPLHLAPTRLDARARHEGEIFNSTSRRLLQSASG
jgi:hypothetical protein